MEKESLQEDNKQSLKEAFMYAMETAKSCFYKIDVCKDLSIDLLKILSLIDEDIRIECLGKARKDFAGFWVKSN